MYEDQHHVIEALKLKKGLIAVTFHFSNWELCAAGSQFLFSNIVAIGRPMKNPYVERWVGKKEGTRP